MLFIGLSLLGYVSYKKLAVELIPNATASDLDRSGVNSA